jgi:hypothetical protein
LFNIMGAEPSDRPEEVAALRASMLSQLRMRQSAPGPDDRIGFLVPTLIVFGGCLILIGAVLVSADKSQLPKTRCAVVLSAKPRFHVHRTDGSEIKIVATLGTHLDPK